MTSAVATSCVANTRELPKTAYNDALREPLPPKITELLRRLTEAAKIPNDAAKSPIISVSISSPLDSTLAKSSLPHFEFRS